MRLKGIVPISEPLWEEVTKKKFNKELKKGISLKEYQELESENKRLKSVLEEQFDLSNKWRKEIETLKKENGTLKLLSVSDQKDQLILELCKRLDSIENLQVAERELRQVQILQYETRIKNLDSLIQERWNQEKEEENRNKEEIMKYKQEKKIIRENQMIICLKCFRPFTIKHNKDDSCVYHSQKYSKWTKQWKCCNRMKEDLGCKIYGAYIANF